MVADIVWTILTPIIALIVCTLVASPAIGEAHKHPAVEGQTSAAGCVVVIAFFVAIVASVGIFVAIWTTP